MKLEYTSTSAMYHYINKITWQFTIWTIIQRKSQDKGDTIWQASVASHGMIENKGKQF